MKSKHSCFPQWGSSSRNSWMKPVLLIQHSSRCDRGASVLHCCQARQQDEPAEDSFFRCGPTPSIHDALMELPFHSKLVYQELQTDLEKAIPTACSTGQSAMGSALNFSRKNIHQTSPLASQTEPLKVTQWHCQ